MIIDGKAIAQEVRAEVKTRSAAFFERTGRRAGLAVVLIGEDPASLVYVRNKMTACEEVGINSETYRLPQAASQAEADALVSALACDPSVDGILVQLPLPAHLDAQEILARIPPEKDVDGFSAYSMGNLTLGLPASVACTPSGVMELLQRSGVTVRGKHAVVLGRSNIVGKPMALLLLAADATVTICHSKTTDLKSLCCTADILVAAVGKPRFVTADMVKEGAAVIDVGINRVDGKLCGDVKYAEAEPIVEAITPVPGGVGSVTTSVLVGHVVEAAMRKANA